MWPTNGKCRNRTGALGAAMKFKSGWTPAARQWKLRIWYMDEWLSENLFSDIRKLYWINREQHKYRAKNIGNLRKKLWYFAIRNKKLYQVPIINGAICLGAKEQAAGDAVSEHMPGQPKVVTHNEGAHKTGAALSQKTELNQGENGPKPRRKRRKQSCTQTSKKYRRASKVDWALTGI